jgi:hypothetical protein
MTVCPVCKHPGMMVTAAIYGPRRAPFWLRLLTLGVVQIVRSRIGYDGFCAHCGERYSCGAGGPFDTWRRRNREARSSAPLDEEQEAERKADDGKPPPPYDPAEDTLIRTQRDYARE